MTRSPDVSHPAAGLWRSNWLAVALVLFVGVAGSGCDHMTEPDGPNLTDLFGGFALLDPFTASTDVVDFAAGETVTFDATFSKQVDWVLELRGQTSGAVRRFSDFSDGLSEANVRWNGGTSELPLFRAETVEAVLIIDDEDADTLRTTVEVATPRTYDATVIADFEEDAGSSILLGNFEFEFDLGATGRSDEITPAQGDFFYLLRSTGGPTVADPFFIGLIGIDPSIVGQTYFPVPTTVPDDLYFNVAVYSFGTPNTIAVIQLVADANGNGTFEDGTDTAINVIDTPVDWEGWRILSVSLAEAGFTQAQVQELVNVRVLLISDDNGQPNPPEPVDFGIDYLNFTAGGPFQP